MVCSQPARDSALFPTARRSIMQCDLQAAQKIVQSTKTIKENTWHPFRLAVTGLCLIDPVNFVVS